MNKCIAVFGAGLSGQSVANLAKSEDPVTVFDETVGKKNDFSESDISCFDDFIFSPGFQKSIRGECCLLKRILFMVSLDMLQSDGRGRFLALQERMGKQR